MFSAPTEKEMIDWIEAFRQHQFYTFESRVKILSKRIQKMSEAEKAGVDLSQEEKKE